MDDFLLLADNKLTLRDWKKAIIERLSGLRLTCTKSRCRRFCPNPVYLSLDSSFFLNTGA
ncbi:MAG: hypothetical protein FJZ96_01325 [Chloroflexi bacterium]|nr:hypothetical protein [Chloroflexota bacterium]